MDDDGVTSVTDLRTKLESQQDERAYVKVLLRRSGAAWVLHHVSALVGAAPSNWAEATWRYERLAFVARDFPAALLAKLCLQDATETVALDDFQVTPPVAQQSVQWRHEPSFARHERFPIPLPTTSYTVSAADATGRNIQPGILVAESCPSFPDPDSAWRAFSEGDYALAGASTIPNEFARIRIAEKQGWIGSIHISATQMTVEVHGNVEGCELELYGKTDRAAQQISKPGTVTFALESGLPEHGWLWLKHGMSWRDYRSIYPQSGWTGNLAQAGVTIETPIDPEANLEALLAAGEGPQVEFKEKLPTSGTRRTLKTVAAFASGNGGTIVFGMNRDEVTVVGLEGDDPTQLRDQLVNVIRATIVPMPHVVPKTYVREDKNILVLEVASGPSAPYGLIADGSSRNKPEYYVRRGASTYPAQPSELREAVINAFSANQTTSTGRRVP